MKPRLYPTMPTYVDRLVPALLGIVAAVHDEGPESVRAQVMRARRLVTPRGVDVFEAVVVGLAAMVDPTKSAAELLGRVDALVPEPASVGSGRSHKPVFRPLLVQAVLDGSAGFSALRGRERGVVVLAWQEAGVSSREIARRTGQREVRQVRRMVARAAGRGQRAA